MGSRLQVTTHNPDPGPSQTSKRTGKSLLDEMRWFYKYAVIFGMKRGILVWWIVEDSNTIRLVEKTADGTRKFDNIYNIIPTTTYNI